MNKEPRWTTKGQESRDTVPLNLTGTAWGGLVLSVCEGGAAEGGVQRVLRPEPAVQHHDPAPTTRTPLFLQLQAFTTLSKKKKFLINVPIPVPTRYQII